MIDDEELDARLGRADRGRVVCAVDPGEFDALAAALPAAGRLRRIRRRWGIAALLAAALAAPFAAAPAVAEIQRFLAQTGEYCSGTECPTVDGSASESIEVGAPDFDAWVEAQLPDEYPLPPGSESSEAVATVQAQLHGTGADTDPEVVVGELAAGSAFQLYASCAWIDEWVAADAVGGLERRSAAGDQLARVVELPVMRAIDGDGGFTAWNRRHVRSAREGDADGVQVAAWQLHCASWDGEHRDAWIAAHGPSW